MWHISRWQYRYVGRKRFPVYLSELERLASAPSPRLSSEISNPGIRLTSRLLRLCNSVS